MLRAKHLWTMTLLHCHLKKHLCRSGFPVVADLPNARDDDDGDDDDDDDALRCSKAMRNAHCPQVLRAKQRRTSAGVA